MINEIGGRLKTVGKRVTGVPYDALDLLRSDHMKLEAALIQLRLTKDPKKANKLFAGISGDLERHMWIEENIFYPACETIPGLVNLMDQSRADHQMVKAALEDLDAMKRPSKSFNELLTKLVIEIEKHVYSEENVVFPSVRKQLKKSEFQRLSQDVLESFYSGRRD